MRATRLTVLGVVVACIGCGIGGIDTAPADELVPSDACPIPGDTAEWRVEPVGLLGLDGTTPREALRSCPAVLDSVWEGAEGIPIEGSVVHLDDVPAILLEWRSDTLVRATVIDERLATDQEVSIRDPIRLLRGHGADLRAGHGAEGILVWDSLRPGLAYHVRFDTNPIMGSLDSIHEDPSLVPDDAEIVRIIWHGQR